MLIQYPTMYQASGYSCRNETARLAFNPLHLIVPHAQQAPRNAKDKHEQFSSIEMARKGCH